MAKLEIPPNIGKVRVAMTLGNKFTVWNGKWGEHEFVLICRNRKEAKDLCEKINALKSAGGEIEAD